MLETASENRFRILLPSEWTSDRPHNDYGIDLRVEIFSPETGGTGFRASGLEFAVQLKATDDETSAAMRVGVSQDHLGYWQSLPYPVLIVRYKAATNELFARWVHERPNGPEEPTVKAWFRFLDSDLLDHDRVRALASGVAAFRNARSGRVRLPVVLRFEGGLASALTAAQWNARFDELLSPGRVHLDTKVPSPLVAVADHERVGVNLGGGIGMYAHLGGTRHTPQPDDVLYALGIVLGRSGAVEDAAMCLRCATGSFLLQQPMSFVAAASFCDQANDVATVLTLLENFAASPSAADLVLQVVEKQPERLDAQARLRVEELHRRRVAQASTPVDLARALYRRGQMLRGFNLHIEALVDLERAATLDVSLRDEVSYWVHLGGSKFMLEQFDGSTAAYARAIAVGDASPRTRMLHSDALLHSGRYRDVIAAGHDVVDPQPEELIPWFLAERVVARFGIIRQNPDINAAEALLPSKGVPDQALIGEIAKLHALTALAVGLGDRAPVHEPTVDDLQDLLASVMVGRYPAEYAVGVLVTAMLAGLTDTFISGAAAHLRVRYDTDLRDELLTTVEMLDVTDAAVIERLFELLTAPPQLR